MRDDEGFSIIGNIVERSQVTDLCLITAPQFLVPLDLADEPYIGQKVQTVGHPNLYALTVGTPGELIQASYTYLEFSSLSKEEKDEKKVLDCDLTNRKYSIKITEEGTQCLLSVPSIYITNALVRPGSSGSPLVNFEGDVVGVVCGMDEYGWGLIVSLPAVKDFLSTH